MSTAHLDALRSAPPPSEVDLDLREGDLTASRAAPVVADVVQAPDSRVRTCCGIPVAALLAGEAKELDLSDLNLGAFEAREG